MRHYHTVQVAGEMDVDNVHFNRMIFQDLTNNCLKYLSVVTKTTHQVITELSKIQSFSIQGASHQTGTQVGLMQLVQRIGLFAIMYFVILQVLLNIFLNLRYILENCYGKSGCWKYFN